MSNRRPLLTFALSLAVTTAASAGFAQGAPAAAGEPAAAPAEEPAAPAEASDESAPDAAAEAEVDEGASTPDPTEAPAAAQTGSLTISSSPAGKLFLDGEDTGETTPVIDFQVAPGTHTIKVIDEATGRSKEVTFHLEAGSVLNLNLNLPETEAEPVAATTQPTDEKKPEEAVAAAAAAAPEDDWTWMTVAGWASLGIGTLGLLAGAVILTTPTDPNQGPLGFGLFGAGAGLVLGGGVLLYLDSELMDSGDDPKPEAEGEKAEAVSFFSMLTE